MNGVRLSSRYGGVNSEYLANLAPSVQEWFEWPGYGKIVNLRSLEEMKAFIQAVKSLENGALKDIEVLILPDIVEENKGYVTTLFDLLSKNAKVLGEKFQEVFNVTSLFFGDINVLIRDFEGSLDFLKLDNLVFGDIKEPMIIRSLGRKKESGSELGSFSNLKSLCFRDIHYEAGRHVGRKYALVIDAKLFKKNRFNEVTFGKISAPVLIEARKSDIKLDKPLSLHIREFRDSVDWYDRQNFYASPKFFQNINSFTFVHPDVLKKDHYIRSQTAGNLYQYGKKQEDGYDPISLCLVRACMNAFLDEVLEKVCLLLVMGRTKGFEA